ncbi:venom allergen 5 2-like [Ceratina calcarata]|uniref:Venom allergen 5 2-like n=1 Tax=Ceratina calcarata TaxID=156304 RepID=A0AAJ7WDM9_9HYME|nr:venom allergen 5 2-like [Ceratina calcarata]
MTIPSMQNPTPAYECGNILSKGLKDWEKKLIVDRHNELRAYVAQGFEIQGRPGPQPGASNMRILSTSVKLVVMTIPSMQNPTPAYECGNILSKGLKDWEKKLIVDRHNELRAYVAQGFEIQGRPGPQPGASNMRILSWDPELAEIAQRWVERCHFENAPCVDVGNYKLFISQTRSSAAND